MKNKNADQQKAVSPKKLILAIDTSCDDTAVAITDGWQVMADIVASQVELHRPYGGVFPTIAKLAHRQKIRPCIELALKRANIKNWSELTAIAVTVGPGLAPALEVGIQVAKDCAIEHHLPLIAVNHLEAHLWSPLVNGQKKGQKNNKNSDKKEKVISETDLPYPFLGMTFSGGHSHFVKIKAPRNYEIMGESLDDAAGECLDKIGRLLNLGYPAGPVIEKLAIQNHGDPHQYDFPLPLTAHHDFNLSFSGLKTYARRLIDKIQKENLEKSEKNVYLNAQQIADLAASAQNAVFRHILYKLNKLLLSEIKKNSDNNARDDSKSQSQRSISQPIFLGGGVAANITFRKQIRQFLRDFNREHGTNYYLLTPLKKCWCGDNATMVGAVASLTLKNKKQNQNLFFQNNPENFDRQPNWPLTDLNDN